MIKPTRLAAVCLIAFTAASTPGNTAEWLGTWGAAPLPPTPAVGPFPATPSFNNVTIRQVVRVSAGGRRLRVRLTNEYGTKPLVIGAASIALAQPSGSVKEGTQHALSFAGKPGVTIAPGAPFLSDAVDLDVPPLATLSISLYVPEDTGPCTCHATALQTGYVSDTGNFTNDAVFVPKQKIQVRAFISELEVQSPGKAVVVLGDSISDGVGSSVDTNRRWPDRLAERLAAQHGGPHWGLVNMGISGNQVLSDGFGQSALARFDRDVLSVAGVQYVVVFEGVNDLGISYGKRAPSAPEFFAKMASGPQATTERLIAGYRQLIERAHEKGLKVIGATITPYEGALYYSESGETIRQAVNTWIRTGRAFDGLLDFDAVIRDPARSTQIKDGFHMGDHLHGSDAAYEAMAKSIDLSLFR